MAPAGTTGRQEPQGTTTGRRELPRTASHLPVAGLVGFLALGAAAGARVIRRGLT